MLGGVAMSSENKFSKQPARIIIIHLTGSEDKSIFQKLVVVLENFFLLVCGMTGTIRLPYFGIILLSNQCKVFLPLQHVKENHLKISIALSKLKWYMEDMTEVCVSENLDIIGIGIQEAVSLYYKQFQHLASGHCSQLELTIFTAHSNKSTLSSVKNAASQLDFQYIKKIETVYFKKQKDVTWPSLRLTEDKNNASLSWQDDLEPSGFVEATMLDPSTVSMQSFFMSWLHNFDTDTEFLRIKFGSGLFIRCDAHERILNPLCLTSHRTLDLSASLLEMRSALFPRKTSAAEPKRDDEHEDGESVHELEVVALVGMDGICDSLLFGNPLILKATTCWKLDWDELETNQRHFSSLCHLLNSRHQAVIVRWQGENSTRRKFETIKAGLQAKHFQGSRPIPNWSATTQSHLSSASSSSSSSTSSPPSFRPHYIILPSTTCSLLLKSIATWELLIPVEVPPLGTCMENSQQMLEAELASVETLPTYNPFYASSNLFASLKSVAPVSPDLDEDIISALPPAPKMRPGGETARKKNVSRTKSSYHSDEISRECNSSKQVATLAPLRVRKPSAPVKRKLYDPGTSSLAYPSEM